MKKFFFSFFLIITLSNPMHAQSFTDSSIADSLKLIRKLSYKEQVNKLENLVENKKRNKNLQDSTLGKIYATLANSYFMLNESDKAIKIVSKQWHIGRFIRKTSH